LAASKYPKEVWASPKEVGRKARCTLHTPTRNSPIMGPGLVGPIITILVAEYRTPISK